MRVALTIEYDGTDYHGFQRQSPHHEPSIQGVLEKAIQKIAGHNIEIYGAGRTDSGVHALGQVVHFDTEKEMEPETWLKAVNAALIETSISVRNAAAVSPDFHARYSALRRCYEYRVFFDNVPSPLRERYSYRIDKNLDVEAMQQVCQMLIGEHNFNGFGSIPNPRSKNPIRFLHKAEFYTENDEITFEFSANAFLKGMVRRMVGAILAVGKGNISVTVFQDILETGIKNHRVVAAPSHSLTLTKVIYPDNLVNWYVPAIG